MDINFAIFFDMYIRYSANNQKIRGFEGPDIC
jgi:hypothetical protein